MNLIKKIYFEVIIRAQCGVSYKQAIREICEGIAEIIFYEDIIELYEAKQFLTKYVNCSIMHPVLQQLYMAHVKYDMLGAVKALGENSFINLGRFGIYDAETIKFYNTYTTALKFKNNIRGAV